MTVNPSSADEFGGGFVVKKTASISSADRYQFIGNSAV